MAVGAVIRQGFGHRMGLFAARMTHGKFAIPLFSPMLYKWFNAKPFRYPREEPDGKEA
jgi:hypothetical protein